MIRNDAFPFLVVCIWLLPFASFQFLPFGIPLYPIEIVLLIASPFLLNGGIREVFGVPVARKIALFSVILLGGALLSYMTHPYTLTGLGQIKSFFLMPMIFWVLMTPLVGDLDHRQRVFQHLRLMFTWAAVVALLDGFSGGFTYDHRLSAWFDSPNLLAIFFLPGVIPWWVHLLSEKIVRVSDAFSWLAVTTVFLLTQSYGAFGAAVVAGVSFLWISRGHVSRKPLLWRMATFTLILAGLGLFFGGGAAVEKWDMLVSGNERSSLSSRLMIWRSAVRMIQDSPWTGIGPGRFQSVYLEYQQFYPPYLEWAVPHPHNLFLAVWLASGVIGVLAGVWLCIFLFRFLKRIPTKEERALMAALFLGLFVSGLFDVPYFRAEFCFMFWLALALFTGMFSCKSLPQSITVTIKQETLLAD